MNDYKIKELYEEMELYLIRSMKKNLKRHLNEENEVGFEFSQWQAEKLKELKRYQRENKSIIGGYTKGLNKEVSEYLKSELKQGSINAIKRHNKALGTNLKPSKIMNKSFFKTNDRKVNSLIKVVNNDLNTVNKSALRMVNDQYRQIIHKSAFFVGNGVMTEKQAVDMATKDFLSRGINSIEYKNGRRVNIASYSQMAVRTASLRTQLMGEGDFRKSIGRSLVQVTTHGTACELCVAWQDKVLVDDVFSGGKPDGKHQLLSEAMAQGFLHPNCRHGLTTYYPELEDEEIEIDEDMLQQEINYADRNIKKYNRLAIGSIDEENISFYSEKKHKWQGVKQKIMNNLHDLKTNERVPLKIYELPKEYSSDINNIINNAPTTMKTLLNNNIEEFKFKNIESANKARYNTVLKNIKLNLKKDKSNNYKTLFHEMSHQLDHILGNISQNDKFEELIIHDFNSLKSKYVLQYKINEEVVYKEISKMLKQESKANSISDIISGITKNKCVGNAYHKTEYWEIKGKLGKETFAHFGSASIRKDVEELELIQQFFPSAFKYFKDELKRCL